MAGLRYYENLEEKIYKQYHYLYSERKFLLLDSSTTHTNPEIIEILTRYNTDVLIIPAKLTQYVQPNDKLVIKQLKYHYRKLRENLLEESIQKINRENLIDMVSRAWSSLKNSDVRNSFRMTLGELGI